MPTELLKGTRPTGSQMLLPSCLDGLECMVEPFNHPITLWVMSSSVLPNSLHTSCITDWFLSPKVGPLAHSALESPQTLTTWLSVVLIGHRKGEWPLCEKVLKYEDILVTSVRLRQLYYVHS